MTNLDAFLTSISTLSVPAWVPIDRATTWLLEHGKQLSFVQAEASGYGLQCNPATRESGGKTFHYLKFEKEQTCPKIMPAPRLSATETEPSISDIG